MASVSSSTTISKPADQVFAHVIDVANHPKWQEGLQEAKVVPDGPIALGSIYHYTTNVMGRQMETRLEVTTFEQGKSWGVTTTGTPKPVEMLYTFEAEGDATKLTVSMELAGGYPAAAEAAVKQQMQTTLDANAAKIKQAVEG